jgi:hypothetical protein
MAGQVDVSTAYLGTGLAATMGGDMRNLIVSSLVSLDGIHGDPQSWAGDYFDQQAAEESLAVLLDSDAMLTATANSPRRCSSTASSTS